MFFDSYWASYKIISLGPTRSMETISQKKAIFSMKNILVSFSSYYRVWHTSRNVLLASTRFCSYHCASYKIISVRLKKLLKTRIFEIKAIFLVKNIWPFLLILSRMIDLTAQSFIKDMMLNLHRKISASPMSG